MAQIQHVVLLKVKPGTPERDIRACYEALHALKQKLPGIEEITGGAYSSPEGLNKGFSHAFVVRFTSAADRNNYLVHPEHETVKQMLLNIVDDVIAFDYEI